MYESITFCYSESCCVSKSCLGFSNLVLKSCFVGICYCFWIIERSFCFSDFVLKSSCVDGCCIFFCTNKHHLSHWLFDHALYGSSMFKNYASFSIFEITVYDFFFTLLTWCFDLCFTFLESISLFFSDFKINFFFCLDSIIHSTKCTNTNGSFYWTSIWVSDFVFDFKCIFECYWHFFVTSQIVDSYPLHRNFFR